MHGTTNSPISPYVGFLFAEGDDPPRLSSVPLSVMGSLIMTHDPDDGYAIVRLECTDGCCYDFDNTERSRTELVGLLQYRHLPIDPWLTWLEQLPTDPPAASPAGPRPGRSAVTRPRLAEIIDDHLAKPRVEVPEGCFTAIDDLLALLRLCRATLAEPEPLQTRNVLHLLEALDGNDPTPEAPAA